jgi:hypothetical protein
MVHGFIDLAQQSLLQKVSDLEWEMSHEVIAADRVGARILQHHNLSWDDATLELNSIGSN